MCKLQKASDSGSRCCCRQACRLYRCFCSPLTLTCTLLFLTSPLPPFPIFPPLFFARALWWSCAKGVGGLSKPPLSVSDFKTQGPRPSVSPNHHIWPAPAESLIHWRRNIWSVLFARINSHTNDRGAPALQEKEEGGGKWRKWWCWERRMMTDLMKAKRWK